MRRYVANRKAKNHGEIVSAFEAFGCMVLDVADHRTLGCDLVVYRQSGFFWGDPWTTRWVVTTIACEVKDSSKPPSARKLKPSEEKFRDRCRANGMPWALVESVEDVKKLMEGA